MTLSSKSCFQAKLIKKNKKSFPRTKVENLNSLRPKFDSVQKSKCRTVRGLEIMTLQFRSHWISNDLIARIKSLNKEVQWTVLETSWVGLNSLSTLLKERARSDLKCAVKPKASCRHLLSWKHNRQAPTKCFSNGETPFHWAARQGLEEVVHILSNRLTDEVRTAEQQQQQRQANWRGLSARVVANNR